MADKLTSADVNRIGIQSDVDSIPLDDTLQNLKNKVNEVIDDLAAVSIGTTNAETTAARPYHTNLKERLDSIGSGQANYMKAGGVVTLDSSGTAVDVTAGEAKVGGIDVKWTTQTSSSISFTSADTRYDVVVVNSDSTLSIATGTEDADPVLPTVASTQKALAILLVTTTAVTVVSDARNQGCWYFHDGAWKYAWKIQDAVDDIDAGEIIIGGNDSRYYEEVDLSGKSNIALYFLSGAKIYRISDTNYCIKSINTVNNETTGIKIFGADCQGNSKAGSVELLRFEYTDEFIVAKNEFDGNSSSSATYKNVYIVNCESFYFVDNLPLDGNGDLNEDTVSLISDSINNTLLANKYKMRWIQVGNDLNIAGLATSLVGLAALSKTRVAFIDTVNEDLRVYDFDGTDWSQTGNDLNIAGIGSPTIAALSSSRIAFIDDTNDDLRTYDFDGTDWSQTGNDLNIATVGTPTITALSSSRIAFIDTTNEDLRTYDFDGTDWAQVGNDLNIAGISTASIAALNSSRISFFENNNKNLETYDFDGTDWAQVGNSLNITGPGTQAITALDNTRIAFVDTGNEELRIYEWDGSYWYAVDITRSIATIGGPSITALSGKRIAFIDLTNDDLRTYEIKTLLEKNFTSSVASPAL